MKYKLCGMYIRKKKQLKMQPITSYLTIHRQYNTTSEVFCAIESIAAINIINILKQNELSIELRFEDQKLESLWYLVAQQN